MKVVSNQNRGASAAVSLPPACPCVAGVGGEIKNGAAKSIHECKGVMEASRP